MGESECMNCGVVVAEAAADNGLHPIQELYSTEAGAHVCEACFFDSYNETGDRIAGAALARKLPTSELAEALAGAATRDELRRLCSVYGVTRPRGATKAETAGLLADARPEVAGREVVTDRD
jgi:hypothetical protein